MPGDCEALSIMNRFDQWIMICFEFQIETSEKLSFPRLREHSLACYEHTKVGQNDVTKQWNNQFNVN